MDGAALAKIDVKADTAERESHLPFPLLIRIDLMPSLKASWMKRLRLQCDYRVWTERV